VDLKASTVDYSGNPVSEEDRITMLLSGMGVQDHKEFDVDIFDQIECGQQFNWDKPPLVSFV
jgi:hypothetical protein